MHINAKLKMKAGKDCWDEVSLIIKDDDIFSLIRFRDRYSCLDLYRRLSIYHFEGFEKAVSVTIDGQDYRWRDEVWRAVLNVTDTWFEEYMQMVELKEPR